MKLQDLQRVASSAMRFYERRQGPRLVREVCAVEDKSLDLWETLSKETNSVQTWLEEADKYVEEQKSAARRKEANAMQQVWQLKKKVAKLEERLKLYEDPL